MATKKMKVEKQPSAPGISVDQIGRYRMLDELGRGATGVVYRAQDPAIGRIIAIKTIRLSDFTDESERELIQSELHTF